MSRKFRAITVHFRFTCAFQNQCFESVSIPIISYMQATKKKAFDYEEGQFICHIYTTIESEECLQTFNDITQLVQETKGSRFLTGWTKVVGVEDNDEARVHMTLLRGHKAIYYHHIKSLVKSIRLKCQTLRPFHICLDELRIFSNYEKTKQFICIASSSSEMCSDLQKLKHELHLVVSEFAVNLTDEDETPDTIAHCSLMCREISQPCREQQSVESVQSENEIVKDLNDLLKENQLDESLFCPIQVNKIEIKIGNQIYQFALTGQ